MLAVFVASREQDDRGAVTQEVKAVPRPVVNTYLENTTAYYHLLSQGRPIEADFMKHAYDYSLEIQSGSDGAVAIMYVGTTPIQLIKTPATSQPFRFNSVSELIKKPQSPHTRRAE